MVVTASAIYMLMPSLEGRANCPATPIPHVHLQLLGTRLQRAEDGGARGADQGKHEGTGTPADTTRGTPSPLGRRQGRRARGPLLSGNGAGADGRHRVPE